MREIKFRAWLKIDKKMVEAFSINFEDYIIIHEMSNPKNPVGKYQRQSSIIEPEYLMQYTGREDKNGKEIYEGDWVKAVFSTGQEFEGEVIFRHGAFNISAIGQSSPSYCTFTFLDKFEVIGNIYENSELLT